MMHEETQPICQSCGYDLRGTPTDTCPECGVQHVGTLPIDRKREVVATICVIFGIVVTPIAMWFAIVSADASLGDDVLAMLLYPYSMTVMTVAPIEIAFPPVILLTMAQFPIYGVLLGLAVHVSWKRFRVTAAWIMAIHGASAIALVSILLS